MSIYDANYSHSMAEFEEMRNLLIQSHALDRKPFNWRLAMVENWFYASLYLEPLEYFTSRVHLWRNAAGDLASFLIWDHSMTYLQVQPGYRFLEDGMLEWAECNWGRDKNLISTMAYDWDHDRQNSLARRGYHNRGAIEDVRIYDLNHSYPPTILPPGFQVTSVAGYGHVPERIELENSIWGVSLDEAWFKGKSSAPSYSSEWDLIIVSPEGRLAAQSLVWLYPQNQTAEIDPLGTHPEFRKRGLSRALVLESFKRMRGSGIRYAYIASETQDPIVSHLYASLQPVMAYQGYHWIKQFA